MYLLDIDGTLLDHEIGIQESSRTAIAQAQANGHRVCLATGRPKTEMDEEILSIPFDGYIYSCGAMVESRDRVLFYQPLEKEIVKEPIPLLQRYAIGFNLKAAEHPSLIPSAIPSSFHASKRQRYGK
ncbi:MAG: HAD hydrolase family protein [Clostridium sp.]